MKKLICLGVALALLAMAILPVGVAAETVVPTTYAKIPFAIVESGFYMLGCLLGDLQPILKGAGLALPIDLADIKPVFDTLGAWTGKPLAWSVDMMAWGVWIVDCVVGALGILPPMVGDILDCIVEALNKCYPATTCNVSNVYRPC